MRFGISATSLMCPKNLRTRLRPVNVCCAIVASRFAAPLRSGPFRKRGVAFGVECLLVLRPSPPSSGLENPESKYPVLKERKATRGALQHTRTSKIASLRTAKPEIAYLPTACGGNLRSLPPAVLSCCRPGMGWQSRKCEGYPRPSPHFLVSDARRVEPGGVL